MDGKFGLGNISAWPVGIGFLHRGFLGAAVVLLWLIFPASGVAHSGFVDKNGCHNNNKKHVFECHSGLLKGQTFKSQAEALKALERMKKAAGTPSNKSAVPAPKSQTGEMKSQAPQQIPVNRK